MVVFSCPFGGVTSEGQFVSSEAGSLVKAQSSDLDLLSPPNIILLKPQGDQGKEGLAPTVLAGCQSLSPSVKTSESWDRLRIVGS